MDIRKNLSLSKSVWSVTFKMLAKYPQLVLPFLIIAVLQGLALAVLYYYPRYPFSVLFGPIVQAFFGVRFLHYPYNFLLLPQFFYYSQILIVVTAGVLMYGMVFGMAYQAHTEGGKLRIVGNFNRSLRKYFSLAGVWLTVFIISLIVVRSPAFVLMKFAPPVLWAKLLLQIFLYGGILLIFFAEMLFIYAYPAIIIERKGFFTSLRRSFEIFKRFFLTTVILVFIPRILDIIAVLLKQRLAGAANLAFPIFPEMSVVVLAVVIIVSFITDSLVFLAISNLFILNLETEKKL